MYIPTLLCCVVAQPPLARPFSPSGSASDEKMPAMAKTLSAGADAYRTITWQTSSAKGSPFACGQKGGLSSGRSAAFCLARKVAALEVATLQACNASRKRLSRQSKKRLQASERRCFCGLEWWGRFWTLEVWPLAQYISGSRAIIWPVSYGMIQKPPHISSYYRVFGCGLIHDLDLHRPHRRLSRHTSRPRPPHPPIA